MTAIHSNWTKPRIYGSGSFFLEDFEILTLILSALKWREKNGHIKMVTDSIGYEFYKSHNMLDMWDEVTTDLDEIPSTINPSTFWAAGKIYALKKQSTPIAAIDTDFIVWDRLAFDNLPDLTYIHSEDIYPDVYPDISHFNMSNDYTFDTNLDWSIRPANAAFYVIKNHNFKEKYTHEAIKFMNNAVGGDNLTYMVFAEQRLMTMLAKHIGIQCMELSNLDKLFENGEKYFTHIWGMKQQMREMPQLRQSFCKKCIDRITADFPQYTQILQNMNELKHYF